jgi:hypothetical protein
MYPHEAIQAMILGIAALMFSWNEVNVIRVYLNVIETFCCFAT